MQVKYRGSLPSVALPEMGGKVFRRGVPDEVPDALGRALCEQPTWQQIDGFVAVEGEHPPFAEWTVDGLRQLGEEWGLEIPAKALKAEIVAAIEAESARRQMTEAPPISTEPPADEPPVEDPPSE